MFYFTYILYSLKYDKTYIGHTTDLRNRLKEHNQGKNFSTKRYSPWIVIYYEACLNESDAKRREGYLKTTQGRRLLKRRLKECFYEMKNSFD